MGDPRPERSRWYDGGVYATVLDRMLSGVHEYLLERLPEGQRVLDACCGTGALSRRLAEAGRDVVGVDLSQRHVEYARGVPFHGAGSVRYELGDVSALELPPEGRYDLAVIAMALHEMPARFRAGVLARLLEVAERTVVVDFAAPMPVNRAGVRNRAIEFVTGWEHFTGFRDWLATDALDGLLAVTGGRIEKDRVIDAGTLRVTTLVAG